MSKTVGPVRPARRTVPAGRLPDLRYVVAAVSAMLLALIWIAHASGAQPRAYPPPGPCSTTTCSTVQPHPETSQPSGPNVPRANNSNHPTKAGRTRADTRAGTTAKNPFTIVALLAGGLIVLGSAAVVVLTRRRN